MSAIRTKTVRFDLALSLRMSGQEATNQVVINCDQLLRFSELWKLYFCYAVS